MKTKLFDVEDITYKEADKGVKIGIDTNIFIKLFESDESLNDLKDKGYIIYTHPECLWEMCKYVKTLKLKDEYTEGVVGDFMRRNGICLTHEEVEEQEIKAFEDKCEKAGIDCHPPDSEIILIFKKEGVEKVCSKDNNFRKAAEFAGMKAVRVELERDKKE